MSESLPEGFEPVAGRTPGTATVRPGRQLQNLDHFLGFGAAIDQALLGMKGSQDEPRQLSLTATVHYVTAADGADPGIVIEYTATLM